MNCLSPRVQAALAELRNEMAASLCHEQMNRLSPEDQAALAELRNEMFGLCPEQALKDENDRLKSQLFLMNEEYLRIQNSLSWKVTKPLRLVKKVLYSLRTVGLRLTLVKIFNRRK